jgi:hypothetical protein
MNKKSKLAEYPLPLRNFLEVDRDGYVSFCYPYKTGSLTSVLNTIGERMDKAMQRSGKERTAALKELKAFIATERAEDDLVSQQWTAEIEKRRAARDAVELAVAAL